MDQEGEGGGEKWTGSFLPPGKETDWGEEPARYTFPRKYVLPFYANRQPIFSGGRGGGGVGMGAGIRKISSICRLLYLPRA